MTRTTPRIAVPWKTGGRSIAADPVHPTCTAQPLSGCIGFVHQVSEALAAAGHAA